MSLEAEVVNSCQAVIAVVLVAACSGCPNPCPGEVTRDLQTVEHGGGIFVAAGSWWECSDGEGYGHDHTRHAAIFVSDDGLVWEEVSPPGLAATVHSLAFTNGIWLAAAYNESDLHQDHTLLGSGDGNTWEPVDPSPIVALEQVVSLGEQFIGIDKNGDLHASPDGCTWTQLSVRYDDTTGAGFLEEDDELDRIVAGNGRLLATIRQVEPGPLQIAVSDDLSNWNAVGLPAAGNWLAPGLVADAFLGHPALYCDPDYSCEPPDPFPLLRSTDGEIWTPHHSEIALDPSGIAYGAGTFVFPDLGSVQRSEDLQSWSSSRVSTAGNRTYRDAIFAEDLFVVVGRGHNVTVSEDGRRWEVVVQEG